MWRVSRQETLHSVGIQILLIIHFLSIVFSQREWVKFFELKMFGNHLTWLINGQDPPDFDTMIIISLSHDFPLKKLVIMDLTLVVHLTTDESFSYYAMVFVEHLHLSTSCAFCEFVMIGSQFRTLHFFYWISPKAAITCVTLSRLWFLDILLFWEYFCNFYRCRSFNTSMKYTKDSMKINRQEELMFYNRCSMDLRFRFRS